MCPQPPAQVASRKPLLLSGVLSDWDASWCSWPAWEPILSNVEIAHKCTVVGSFQLFPDFSRISSLEEKVRADASQGIQHSCAGWKNFKGARKTRIPRGLRVKR